MLLQDIINTAKYSELNGLAVANQTETIVSFINLGLIELYKEFALHTEEHIISLQDNVTIYDLPADFMYLVAAYGEVPKGSDRLSNILPVNVEDDVFSINTISYNQVQVPLAFTGEYVSLIYVRKPVMLTLADLGEEVDIPDQLLTPLLNFVAFKARSAVEPTMEGGDSVYWTRFANSVKRVKELGIGIAPDDYEMKYRISDRGFV